PGKPCMWPKLRQRFRLSALGRCALRAGERRERGGVYIFHDMVDQTVAASQPDCYRNIDDNAVRPHAMQYMKRKRAVSQGHIVPLSICQFGQHSSKSSELGNHFRKRFLGPVIIMPDN